MDDNRMLRDALDACRPSDLADSEPEVQSLARALETDAALRVRWERSLRLDEQIATSFVDVPVPESLQEQILGSIRQAESAEETALPDRPNRRLWLQWSLGVTAAAALVLAFLLVGRGSGKLSEQQLVEFVVSWHDAKDLKWSALAQPSTDYAIPDNVFAHGQSQWRTVGANELDAKAVAYDLSAKNDGSAVLYVIRTRRSIPLSQLSLQSLSVTGGWKIGAWRGPGVIFVIVVRGQGPEPAAFTEQSPLT